MMRGDRGCPRARADRYAPVGNRLLSFAAMGMAATLVCALVLSCRGGAQPSAGASPVAQRDSVYVIVDNQNFLDVTISVTFSGAPRLRLGTVPGSTRQSFGMRYESTELRFRADFVGIRTDIFTDAVYPRPGELIELTVRPDTHRTGRIGILRR